MTSRPLLACSVLIALSFGPMARAALPAASTLAGDDVIGPSAGTQDEPQLVEGDGSQWLLVWRDDRAALAGTLGSDTKDIWAIRLDADGVPIDTVAFPVASGPWSEQSPRAAWNGTDWLVAYDADAATAAYWSQGVVARRVDADGFVLDDTAIELVDAADMDESLWDVASDGLGWAVIWQDVDAAGSSYVLDGATVDGSGLPSDVVRVWTPSSSVSAPWNAELAWGTDRYMIAWSGWGDDDDILALPVDQDLVALRSPIEVAGDGYSTVQPSIAAGGDGFYVAWFDDTFGAYWCTVEGTPLSESGTVGIPDGENLSDESWPLDVAPDVAWMGTGWGVAWEYGAAAAIYTSLVDTEGTPGAIVNTTGALDYTRRPSTAAGDGQLLLSWSTLGGMSDSDLKSTFVGTDGLVGEIQDATIGAPAQTHPAIAAGSGGYLVVAESQTADELRILAWRTDLRGRALDAEPIELATGTSLSDPAVAWNGSVYLVVWTDTDGATVENGVVGMRVGSDGTVLDDRPFEIVTGLWPAVAASTDGTFLVAAAQPYSYDQSRLVSIEVSDDGTVDESSGLILGSNYAEYPDVSAFGTGWIVTWDRRHSHDSALRNAEYSVVSADGTASVEALVRTAGSTAKESGVHVASSGAQTLIVWSDNGDIRGRRVDASGSLLGVGRGFVISAAENAQFDPDVAWNGSTFTVTWTDWRAHAGLEPGEGDVYTTSVSGAGRVASMTGVGGATTDVPEGNAVVAGLGGRTVYVWTRLHEEAPYASFRLETTSLGGRTAPTLPGLGALGAAALAGLLGLRRRRDGPGRDARRHADFPPGA